MKTITFYSYKGGVGRTLALVNIADRLAEFGKKVCVMDFDLEAPGLNYKYKHLTDKVEQGLVDYIYEFAVKKNLPDSIGKYAKEITKYKYPDEKNLKKRQNNIVFIPSGNSESSEYWKKLSHISWWNLFYEENSEGIPFFLDLKEKIKKEFNPDYLLIDSRTGITEISAITISILTDSIVLLAIDNEENICGMQRIIETIIKEENNLLDAVKEIHFVLTRLPQITSSEKWTMEESIRNRVRRKIEQAFQNSDKKLSSFNVIHSNEDIALYDKITMSYDFIEKTEKKDLTPSISSEYLSLFDSLTENDLSKKDKEKFNSIKREGELIKETYESFTRNDPDFLMRLNNLECSYPQSSDVYLLYGVYYFYNKKYHEAIQYFTKSIELGESLGNALYFRGSSYYSLQNYSKALEDYEKYISENYGNKDERNSAINQIILAKKHLGTVETDKLIEEAKKLIYEYPDRSEFYNILGLLYRDKKEYELALTSIYKAIELNPREGEYFANLAEIRFLTGDKFEFYSKFDEALNRGFDLDEILNDNTKNIKNIYKQAINDLEFIRILNKHNKIYFRELLQKDTN